MTKAFLRTGLRLSQIYSSAVTMAGVRRKSPGTGLHVMITSAFGPASRCGYVTSAGVHSDEM